MKIFQKLEINIYEKRVFRAVKKTIKKSNMGMPCLSGFPSPQPMGGYGGGSHHHALIDSTRGCPV